jgi:hypothetical protein
MPPVLASPSQSELSFTRATPRRTTRQIIDYNTIERREVVPTNTSRVQAISTLRLSRTAISPTNTADSAAQDGDSIMVDHVGETYNSSDEDPAPDTPSRRLLPSLITIRRERTTARKPRKPREESTWTLHHFNVTPMTEHWVNTSKVGHPRLQNRMWSCKYCNFTSTDKSRCGNSSNTNDHMKEKHRFKKADNTLGKRVTHGITKSQQGSIDQYTVAVEVSTDATEALI